MRDDAVDQTMQPSLRDTLDEHHDCMQAVDDVEKALARHPDPDHPWLPDLLRSLGALRTTLAEHFASEQKGALYCEVPFKKPYLAGKIDRLAGEHTTMLATLDTLEEAGAALVEPEPPQLRSFIGRVQLLVATIRRHEAEENEIIMDAYWNEVGVGD